MDIPRLPRRGLRFVSLSPPRSELGFSTESVISRGAALHRRNP